MKNNSLLILIIFIMGFARAQLDGAFGDLNPFIVDKDEVDIVKDSHERKILDNVVPLENAIDAAKYELGPGDELGVNIIMGKNFTFPIKITPTGDIFIPSVGSVNILGYTLNAAKEKIINFIIKDAYPNAKVSITLLKLRTFKIQVIGGVNKPGFVEISAVDRLDEIIEKVEGFHYLAKEYDILIARKSGINENINFFNFLLYGDLEHNPMFKENDIISIPFEKLSANLISIRGQVENIGYDIIEPNESLFQLLKRRIDLGDYSDLNSIIVTRNVKNIENIIEIFPSQFEDFTLLNGDIIDISRQNGIMVNGFVQKPGAYDFVSGFTVYNYVSMAGGISDQGSLKNILIRHNDGTTSKNLDLLLKRGDVIIVKRSVINAIAGNASVLQIIASVFSIYLTYLATQN